MRILIVASDRDLVDRLSDLLAEGNFEVAVADDVVSGLARAITSNCDLIIIAAVSPAGGDLAFCAELRRRGIDASILMLTDQRVAGLKLGADDCVPHNCDINELLARVEALLRRVPRSRRAAGSTLRFGDVEIDFATAEARKGGHELRISVREFRLLEYLAAHRDRVVSRKEILQNVWEYDSTVTSRTVDVHIGWLRQKLEDKPQQPKYIKTIRGLGYRFDCDCFSLLTLVSGRQRIR